MFDDDFSAFDAGTAYALFRHGQDRQVEDLARALNQRQSHDEIDLDLTVHVERDEDQTPPAPDPVRAADLSPTLVPREWEDYIGQDPLKQQLLVRIRSALKRGAPLKHVLLASGYPGVGKTTMARLVAKMLDVKIVEIVPPFGINTVIEAADKLGDRDVLFIDEIHKLADNGARGAEILLKVLEEGIAPLPSGEMITLPNITVIGATTDRDKLPETIVDRFKIKPYFQPYTLEELGAITANFCWRHTCFDQVDDDLGAAIACACRGTPRIAEELVLAAQDLGIDLERVPSPEELLAFVEVEPDGMTRQHIHYLTAMYQYYGRWSDRRGQEYVAGEHTMMSILRERKEGLAVIERFLIERGLLNRSPQGRKLTARGIDKAKHFVSAGKGASDVA